MLHSCVFQNLSNHFLLGEPQSISVSLLIKMLQWTFFSGHPCAHVFIKAHALKHLNICIKTGKEYLLNVGKLCLRFNLKEVTWGVGLMFEILRELSTPPNTEDPAPTLVKTVSPGHIYIGLCVIYKCENEIYD